MNVRIGNTRNMKRLFLQCYIFVASRGHPYIVSHSGEGGGGGSGGALQNTMRIVTKTLQRSGRV